MTTEDTRAALTGRPALFVAHYLGDERGNATGAARAAGYRDPGKSGAQLLRRPEVREAIDTALDELAMTSAEIIAELSEVARAPWRDFVTVKTNDAGETVSVRMNLTDKLRALELLGKSRAMFTDRQEHSGSVGPVVVKFVTLPYGPE